MANAITIANKPEKETKDTLNHKQKVATQKVITVIAINKRGRKGFENRIIVVITIVSPILTKMALPYV
jgi:hypothetical protein